MVVVKKEETGTPMNSHQQQPQHQQQHQGSQPPQMYQQQPQQQYVGVPPGPPPIVVNPPPIQYSYQQQQMAPIPVGPYSQPAIPLGSGMWSTELFDCAGDCPNFCLSLWCPCISFGQVAEIVDRGTSTCGMSGGIYALLLAFTGFHFIYSCTYRTKMRRQYGIPGDDVADCCIHFWCEACALSQEYRELQIRGYDVPLGWHGNMIKLSQGVNMAPPPVPTGMTR